MKKSEAVSILQKELVLVMQYNNEKPLQAAMQMAISELEKGVPDHVGGRLRCRCGMISKVESELYRQTNTWNHRIVCESGHIKTKWCTSLDEANKQWKLVMG